MLEIIDNGMLEFESAIKSDRTKILYNHYLNKFLGLTKLETPERLLTLGKKEPKQLSALIMTTIESMKKEEITDSKGKKLGPSTMHGLYKAIKHYCIMNDIILNWDKLAKILPSQTRADDRAITREEIMKLLQYSNLQSRGIVLFMASGGFRIRCFTRS